MDSGNGVIIAGMHRSGTSMVTRLLNSYGYYLGPKHEMIPPNQGNPEGHWENTQVMEFNDRLLSALGGTWTEPPLIPSRWERSEPADFAAEIAPLLDKFRERTRWAIKDPRYSLTYSFWARFLPGVPVIICLRNPLEVAASLQKRDGLSFDHSLGLWHEYNQQILKSTDPKQRIVTHYSCYFSHREEELERVLHFLKRKPSQRALRRCTSTIRSGLRHTRFMLRDLVLADIPPETVQLYLLMCEEAGWDDWLGLPSGGSGDTRGAGLFNETLADLCERRMCRPTRRRTDRTGGASGQSAAALHERMLGLEAKLLELAQRNEDLESRLLEERTSQAQRMEMLEDQVISRTRDLEGALEERNGFRDDLKLLLENVDRGYGKLLEMDGRLSAIVSEGRSGKSKEYEVLRPKLLDKMRPVVPFGSTVLVVSKGDDRFLEFLGRRTWHFPRNQAGEYAGYHPHDSSAAIVQLEYWRAQGADFLVFPAAALWWLDHYEGLRRYLYRNYSRVFFESDLGLVFSLNGGRQDVVNPWRDFQEIVEACTNGYHCDPSILDLTTEMHLAASFPESSVFSPPDGSKELPYLDDSVDIVVTDSTDPHSLASAERVARLALVRCLSPDLSMGHGRAFEVQTKGRVGGPGEYVSLILTRSDPAITEGFIEVMLDRLPRDFDGEFIVEEGAGDGLRAAIDRHRARASAGWRVRQVPPESDRLDFMTAAGYAAAGSVLLFLDPDVVPLPGWLPALTSVLERYPTAGAVCGKLFRPDGLLCGAGGIVFRDGSSALFGQGSVETEAPLFNHLRAVDFSPAVLLAVRRSVFLDVGGFGQSTGHTGSRVQDFGLKLNAEGHFVFYQPESRAVCGTDAATLSTLPLGLCEPRTIAQNRGGPLAAQPDRPQRLDATAWHDLSAWRAYGAVRHEQ